MNKAVALSVETWHVSEEQKKNHLKNWMFLSENISNSWDFPVV